jgi:restriction system protein
MSIPGYQSLMLPVLRLATDGEKRVADIEDPLANEFALTPEEREELLPSGRQRVLSNRIHWAKFYMTKAGLLASPRRGRFIITDVGKALLARNPKRVDISLLSEYPQFREFYMKSNGAEADGGTSIVESAPKQTEADTPEERIEAAYQAVLSALRAELLERISQNSPTFFERLIVDLLVAMGYGGSHKDAATQLGRSGDGGVDGVISEDRLGLDRVYVQAKRYAVANSIGRPEVQAFLGSLVGLGATKGVFVTTSTFTAQAREFVTRLPQRVILLDGRQLADLMIEHGVGVRASRTIVFNRLDEDFFDEPF